MQEVSKEPYYKVGDTITYRFGNKFVLKKFLGYALVRVLSNGKRVLKEKTHEEKEEQRLTNTEHWIAENTSGNTIMVGLKVPHVGLIDSLKTSDETALVERTTELYDPPDCITCSLEEFYTGKYDNKRIHQEYVSRFTMTQNEIAFRFKVFDICKRNKIDIPKHKKSSSRYQQLCNLEILAFMLYQQRMYPTIKGFKTIQHFKKENPEIAQELKYIENNLEWVNYDKYKKTQSTERGS